MFLLAGITVIVLGAIGATRPDDEARAAGPTAPAGSTGSETGATGSPTGGTAGPTGDTGGAETPEAFLPVFSEAIRNGDQRFLFARLHPVVTEFYGPRTCRAYVRGFEVPNSDFVFRSTGEPTDYLWVVDGVSTTVPNVLTVDVTAVTEDGESEREIHLGVVEGDLRWFVDCGDPA